MELAAGRRLQVVQVFRGAAALLVVLFHAASIDKYYLQHEFLGDVFMFGYGGVDFFFVLSGFVIVLAHGREIGEADRLRPYLVRRFVRIYPVYWIVAALLAPLYFGAPHHAVDLIALLKAFLLLDPNNNPVVAVAWSLTHEVFFYGMFGLAIWWPSRGGARRFFTIWLSLSAAWYVGLLLSRGRLSWPVAGFLFSPYNLEFAMGAAVGYVLRSGGANRGRTLVFLGAVLFLASGAIEPALHRHFSQRHSIVCYGFSSMLLVWGAVQWERSRGARMPALLMRLGDASYSIYLTHYALLDLIARASVATGVAWAFGPTVMTTIIIVLAVSLGMLFYACVERPLLARLRPRPRVVPIMTTPGGSTFPSEHSVVTSRRETPSGSSSAR